MNELISQLLQHQECEAGATERQIVEAEVRLGVELSVELRRLLFATSGALVWKDGIPSKLLSVEELAPAGELLGNNEAGPTGIIGILAQESDIVGIVLDSGSPSFGTIVDCSHETFPFELGVVAESLQEMLRLLLESEGREWVWPAVLANGRDLAEESSGSQI